MSAGKPDKPPVAVGKVLVRNSTGGVIAVPAEPPIVSEGRKKRRPKTKQKDRK